MENEIMGGAKKWQSNFLVIIQTLLQHALKHVYHVLYSLEYSLQTQ